MQVNKVMQKQGKTMALMMATAIAAACVLIFSKTTAGGVKKGLDYAADILIPSLFPFMVLSSFAMRSGLSELFGKLFGRVFEVMFSLPRAAAGAIVLSLVGGYPIGAKCVRLLYDEHKLTSRQAEQMMCFCVCSGPAFLITGVGVLLLHDAVSGLILYLSQLFSALLIGIVSGLVYRKKTPSVKSQTLPDTAPPQGILSVFVQCCSDGALSVIQLTSLVTIFAVLTALCGSLGITDLSCAVFRALGADFPTANSLLYILTEVTSACKTITDVGAPLWLLSAASGFGGLCVHFQLFLILGDIPIRKTVFFSCRIVNMILSSVIVYTVCLFYRPTAEVFAIGNGAQAEWLSVSAAGSAAMVILSVLFLLSLGTKGKGLKRNIFLFRR